MELHRPHDASPFRSWQAFVIEIATIVIGVLIALSFEGAREWNHDRTLVNEARAALRLEITDNKRSVDADLTQIDRRKKDLDDAQRFADEILASGSTKIHSLTLNVALGDLSSASWKTADRTGALGHMSYADVQQFAGVYTLQELYETQERRSLEHLSEALSLISAHSDPEKAPRGDLESFRERILLMNGDLYLEQQLAKQLTDRYAKVLSAK